MGNLATKKKTPVKLSDVALAANVSPATASLALRNHPSITEETRQKVLQAQRTLGYHSLRKYGKMRGDESEPLPKSATLMCCSLGKPIDSVGYLPFLDGAQAFCREAGIALEVTYQPDAKTWPDEPPHFHKKVDGVILTGNVTQAAVDYFNRFHVKTLVLGNFRVEGAPTVEVDIFWVGGEIARKIRQRGYRNIVFFRRSTDNYYERQYLMGVRDELETDRECTFTVLGGGDTHEEVSAGAEQILTKIPRVDAVICDSLPIAEICLTELRVHKSADVPLPAIFSCASSSTLRHSPGIQVYNLGLEKCGREAARRLHAHLQGQEDLACSFIIRNNDW